MCLCVPNNELLFLKVARYGLLLHILQEMYKRSNFLPKVSTAWRQTDKQGETLPRRYASYSFLATGQKQTNANVLETSISIHVLSSRSCCSGFAIIIIIIIIIIILVKLFCAHHEIYHIRQLRAPAIFPR